MTYRLRNIGIAIALAVVAALLTTFYVTNYKRSVQHGESKVPVYVASRDIALGTPGVRHRAGEHAQGRAGSASKRRARRHLPAEPDRQARRRGADLRRRAGLDAPLPHRAGAGRPGPAEGQPPRARGARGRRTAPERHAEGRRPRRHPRQLVELPEAARTTSAASSCATSSSSRHRTRTRSPATWARTRTKGSRSCSP